MFISKPRSGGAAMALDAGAPGSIGRRTVLRTSALGAVAVVAGVSPARAADPVRLGMIFAKQGVSVDHGANLAAGARLALEQAGSTVLNRPVELLWYDEPSPQVAAQSMTKLVEEDKVAAVMGGTLTNYALAISAVSKRTKTPFLASNAVAREITGKDCHPYVFRLPTTTPTIAKAMTPTLATLGKRWYFLVSSFGFGLDVYATFKGVMTELGATEVAFDQTPLGTNDFSAFLLKIRQMKPDVVICGVPGQDFSNLLKQYKEFGLRGRIPLVQPSVGDNDLWAIGPETAYGICGAPWHYSDPANPADEKAMVAAYTARNNKPPAPGVWLGWLSMRFILAAIDKAQSTEGGAIVRAMEQVRLGDETSPAYFRTWDHQMLHRTLVTKVKDKITDKWDFVDIIDQAPKTPAGLDALFGTQAEIGCTMGEI